MALIYQTIPQRHIRQLLETGHYFTPCCAFSDKAEFRYGYCLFNDHFSSARALEKCVRRTRSDVEVNRWIDSTGVSCWVREIGDESQMWKVHGRGSAAIRISIDADSFWQHAESQGHATASGDVTYGGMTSQIRPQFLGRWRLGDAEDAIHHLFFHKRPKYQWEHEFRVVLFSKKGISIKMVLEKIDSVEISPLGKLDPRLKRTLRSVFGNRLRELGDGRSRRKPQTSKSLIDETITNPEIVRLVEKLRNLKAQDNVSGKDWMDPKASRAEMKRSLKLAKQIFEVGNHLRQAIAVSPMGR